MTARTRTRYLFLGTGAAVSLFAVHGPFDVAIAAWLFPPLLLAFSRGTRVWPGALWILGTLFATSVWWLWTSGLDPFSLSPLGLAMAAVGAVPYVLDRLTYPALARRGAFWATLVFPAAQVGGELLLATVTPLGSIYGSLAMTQHDNLPLLQVASVTGQYGVSALVAWTGAAIAVLLVRPLPVRAPRLPIAVVAGTLAVVFVCGVLRINLSPKPADSVRIAGISASRSVYDVTDNAVAGASFQELGKNGNFRQSARRVDDDLIRSTIREARAGARIIVWPEGGAAVTSADRPWLYQRVAAVARRYGVYVNVGVGVITSDHPRNQSVLFGPSGKVLWTYDKGHPAPGEVWPPGPGIAPTATTPYATLSSVICFDADFPPEMRQAAAKGTDIMLVPSNDWPGFDLRHSEKTRIRAIENGYSLVREDVKGVSVAWGPLGDQLGAADYYATPQQTMVVQVPRARVFTLYSVVGDLFAYLTLGGLAVLLAAAYLLHRRDRRPARPAAVTGVPACPMPAAPQVRAAEP